VKILVVEDEKKAAAYLKTDLPLISQRMVTMASILL
jgi:hypothetical protein